jgi:hypothetical protein
MMMGLSCGLLVDALGGLTVITGVWLMAPSPSRLWQCAYDIAGGSQPCKPNQTVLLTCANVRRLNVRSRMTAKLLSHCRN